MLWEIINILGIFCLAYYCYIWYLLKRWDSTFSRFWIFAGVFLLIVGKFKIRMAVWFLLVFAVIFLIAELRVLLGMIPCREKNIPYLIVLGAQVRGTRLSGSLYRRIERAREYLSENPDTIVIVSGGQGKGEDITEALAMQRYLEEQGIEKGRILQEGVSTTTEENLRFSAKFVSDMSKPVGIVTNNFHMYRACCYAKRTGYQNPRAIPASCHPAFFLNYMVREFFALLKMMLLNLTKKQTMI